MVCGSCYRIKTEVAVKPRRDWFILTFAMQSIAGGLLLWLTAWLLGRLLLNLPSSFHEGNMWERFGG